MLKAIRIVCIGAVLVLSGAMFTASVEKASAQAQGGASKKSAKKSAKSAARSGTPRGNAGSGQNVDRSEFAPNSSGMADRHDARNSY
jgi:Flp pilus assembly protein TadB